MTNTVDWRGQKQYKQPVVYSQAPSAYASVNFPPNPNIGDQFISPNGSVYEWDGMVWVGVVPNTSGSANVPIDTNPPTGAVSGQLWWRNDPDCTLYILFNDGTSTQWVPATRPGGGAPGIADAPNDGNMYVRQNGQWVLLPP